MQHCTYMHVWSIYGCQWPDRKWFNKRTLCRSVSRFKEFTKDFEAARDCQQWEGVTTSGPVGKGEVSSGAEPRESCAMKEAGCPEKRDPKHSPPLWDRLVPLSGPVLWTQQHWADLLPWHIFSSPLLKGTQCGLRKFVLISIVCSKLGLWVAIYHLMQLLF